MAGALRIWQARVRIPVRLKNIYWSWALCLSCYLLPNRMTLVLCRHPWLVVIMSGWSRMNTDIKCHKWHCLTVFPVGFIQLTLYSSGHKISSDSVINLLRQDSEMPVWDRILHIYNCSFIDLQQTCIYVSPITIGKQYWVLISTRYVESVVSQSKGISCRLLSPDTVCSVTVETVPAHISAIPTPVHFTSSIACQPLFIFADQTIIRFASQTLRGYRIA